MQDEEQGPQGIRALDIARLGQTEGISAIPNAEARSPQATELRIEQAFAEWVAAKRSATAIQFQRALNEFSSRANSPVPVADARKVPAEARNELEAALADRQSDLRAAQGNLVSREHEWMTFRATNELLDRNAQYPSSQILHWSIVILLVVAESVINAKFFAVGEQLGLLGGVLTAFIISLVNVGVASMLLGAHFFKSALFARHTVKRTAGIALSIFFVFFLLAFNLLVAHYRGMLEQGLTWQEHLAAATSLFDFGDAHSIQLFFVGIVICVIAMIEGYKSDDEYPGYGHIDRQYRAVKKRADEVSHSVHQQLQACIAQCERRLKDLSRVEHERIATMQRLAAEVNRLPHEFATFAQLADARFRASITVYRQNNLSVRPTQAPRYWDAPISLAESTEPLPQGDTSKISVEIAAARSNQERLAEAYTDAAAELSELHRSAGEMVSDTTERLRRSLITPGAVPLRIGAAA